MDTTTLLPTPPTSGAIVQSGGRYDGALAELITNNNISDTRGDILSAIASGNAAVIAADQAGHLINQKATMDGSVAGINATNLNGVANTETTNRNGLANITSTERNSGEIRMNVAKEAGESRLASAINTSEIRELINATSTTNLVAIKENGFAIRDESCKTREVITCKIWDLEKETLKGFHQTQLEALKNKCDLEAKIAECCCEQKAIAISQATETRALILAEGQKRLETENSDLRLQLLLKNGVIK